MSIDTVPTVSSFRSWMRTHGGRLTQEVLTARSFAKSERERVNAYTLPIFNRYTFTVSAEVLQHDPGTTIDSPDKLYLAERNEVVAAYDAEVQAATIAHGWQGNPEFCPALVAQSRLVDAENALIRAWLDFMGKEDRMGVYGEMRERLLNTIIEGYQLFRAGRS